MKPTIHLSNKGLRVLHIPVAETNDVTIMFNVLAGSNKEIPAMYGMAHFLEHMFFKGTNNRDNIRLNRDLSLCGASWNAMTSQTSVKYFLRVPKHNFEKAFELLTDLFFEPSFPEEELEKERGVIIEEINMYNDDPTFSFYDQAQQEQLDPAYGHKILGPKANIMDFQRNNFIQYRSDHYTPNNFICSIAGDISLDEALKTINEGEHIPELHCNSTESVIMPSPLWSGARTRSKIFERKNIEQAQLMFMFDGVPLFHDLFPAYLVFISVLGDGPHSLLWQRIREELGLCYRVSSYWDSEIYSPKISLTGIYVGLSPDKLQICEDEALKCMFSLRNNDYDKEIFDCAREHLIGNLTRKADNTYGLSNFYTSRWIFRTNKITVKNLIEDIREVKQEQVLELADKLLKPENYRMSYMLPEKET